VTDTADASPHLGPTREREAVNIAGLTGFFRPDTVAVLGAGRVEGTIGNSMVRNLATGGYWGEVRAVNRKGGAAYGVTYDLSVADCRPVPDLAIVCVPAPAVETAVRECAAAGVPAALVVAAEMGEHGGEGVLWAAALSRAVQETGIRVMGPNTLGYFVAHAPGERLQATYLNAPEAAWVTRGLAVIGQGGGLTSYVGSEMLLPAGHSPGFLIDTGNELDVDCGDCIAYLDEHTDTATIGLVLESAKRGRKLVDATRRALMRGIRVVILRLGRTVPGRGAAGLHTGALSTGSIALWHELEDLGAFVTGDERDFVAAVTNPATARRVVRNSPRVGIVTWSGGFGVQLADVCAERGFEVPAFSRPPSAEEAIIFRSDQPANPLDLGGYHSRAGELPSAERLRAALEYVLGQTDIDVCVLSEATVLQRPDEVDKQLKCFADVLGRYDKPIFLSGSFSAETRARLRSVGVYPYHYPSDLGAALASQAAPGRQVRAAEGQARTSAAARADLAGKAGTHILTGADAAEVVNAAGIRTTRAMRVTTPSDVIEAGKRVGYPIFLKYYHERVVHKSEHGLLTLVHSPADAAGCLEELAASIERSGLSGGEMLAEEFISGFELAVGGYIDDELGPTVMVGRGGTELEVLKDVAFALAPVDRARAEQMIDRLAVSAVLRGARTAVPYDVGAVLDAVVAASELLARRSTELKAIDLNPLMVLPEGRGVVAVDVVIATAG
jgi:acetate---CoA ligase (ADP-forming)